MGQQLIKQPNGLLCFWSTVTDSLNGFDFTAEEYIEEVAKRQIFDQAVSIYQKVMQLEEGGKPYYQFTKSWDEAAHPTCDCGDCDQCSGEETREPKELKWIANIEAGRTAGGKVMKCPRELEVRRSFEGVDVLGVYWRGRLMGYVAKHSFAKGWHWETPKGRYKGDIGAGVELLDALEAVLPGEDRGKLKKALCKKCEGTGVIETGNNDFPCECPFSDRVMFNVTGRGQVSGATLKAEQAAARKPCK